jgi:hypothetical protein
MCSFTYLEHLERIAQVEHIVRMHEIQVDLNICNAEQETAGKCI